MRKIINYLFEVGTLKNIKRSGWWCVNIRDPESVADHSYRVGIISFLLARLEGESDQTAQKLACAALFHDLHEARILDLHKVAARYIDGKGAAKQAEKEQTMNLPVAIQESVKKVIGGLSGRERVILKDADLLEVSLQAKEYVETGYVNALEWMENAGKKLRTKNAKKLFKELKKAKTNEWYRGLKRLDE